MARIYIITSAGKMRSRKTTLFWQEDEEGHIPYGKLSYFLNPEYSVRRERRPFWHFFLILPMFLLPPEEETSFFFHEGNPQGIDIRTDPLLQTLMNPKTSAAITRFKKNHALGEIAHPRKAEPLMLLLILSVGANIALAIAIALRSLGKA